MVVVFFLLPAVSLTAMLHLLDDFGFVFAAAFIYLLVIQLIILIYYMGPGNLLMGTLTLDEAGLTVCRQKRTAHIPWENVSKIEYKGSGFPLYRLFFFRQNNGSWGIQKPDTCG